MPHSDSFLSHAIERERWRRANRIVGKCYAFRSRHPRQWDRHAYVPGYLLPSGICLSTRKRYFIQEDPNGWAILYMTDDEEKFDRVTKHHYAGTKGLFRNVTCWDVLAEMQHEGGRYYELDSDDPLSVMVCLRCP